MRFTGDLEEDVALLERLEAAGGGGAGAEPGGGRGGLATEEKREGTEAATPDAANGGGSTRVPALKLGLKLPLPGGSSGNGGGGAPPEPKGGGEGGREEEKEEEGQQTLLRQGSSSSALTELGEKMGSQSAKGHLTIFQGDLRSSMVRKQQSKLDSASPAGGPAQNYAAEREARRLYREEALHAQLLETLLHLLFRADGTLDKQYHERFPLEHRIPNVPFTLAAHLNHPENQAVTKRLLNRFQGLDTPAARGIARYLRLLAGNTYCKALYTSTRKIARGAFADVFACSLPPAFDPGQVILKAVDLPETVFDATVVPDVFSEISIMEAFKDSAHACTLLDYGIHGNRVHMVLERYPTRLRAWRAAHGRLGAGQVRLYPPPTRPGAAAPLARRGRWRGGAGRGGGRRGRPARRAAGGRRHGPPRGAWRHCARPCPALCSAARQLVPAAAGGGGRPGGVPSGDGDGEVGAAGGRGGVL